MSGRWVQVGDRMPPVRELKEQYGISISTALQVYSQLERKGLVEPREKSGYFVQFSPRRSACLDRSTTPDQIARPVSIDAMVAETRDSASRPDIVNLSLPTPPPELLPAGQLHTALLHTIRQEKPDYLRHSLDQGDARLRRLIARQSLLWGGAVDENEVVITNGCMDALSLCLRAVAGPGDTILTESPTFYGILQTIQYMEMKVLEFPTSPRTGIRLDKLEATLKKRKIAACLLVNTFNNPLGSCMPDEHKEQLVSLLARHEVPLIEDDIYGELYFGGQRPKPSKYFDKKGLVLHCSSFSKTLAPSFRIGWTLPGRFREKIMRIKYMNAVSPNGLLQQTIAQYMETNRFERHLKKLRYRLSAQMMQTQRAIHDYFPKEIFTSNPEGGMTLWIQLPAGTDSYTLYRRALRENIHISPGLIYSTQQEKYQSCIRISFAEPWSQRKEKAFAWLGRALEKGVR